MRVGAGRVSCSFFLRFISGLDQLPSASSFEILLQSDELNRGHPNFLPHHRSPSQVKISESIAYQTRRWPRLSSLQCKWSLTNDVSSSFYCQSKLSGHLTVLNEGKSKTRTVTSFFASDSTLTNQFYRWLGNPWRRSPQGSTHRIRFIRDSVQRDMAWYAGILKQQLVREYGCGPLLPALPAPLREKGECFLFFRLKLSGFHFLHFILCLFWAPF